MEAEYLSTELRRELQTGDMYLGLKNTKMFQATGTDGSPKRVE